MKSKRIHISLILSTLSIAISIWIHITIANEYLAVSGKTKALFGLKEIYQFGYQYYVALLGLIAIILAFVARTNRNIKALAIGLSIVSIAVVFLRCWRLFV